jgi:hypothetical protein
LKTLTIESPDNIAYQVILGRSLRDQSRLARLIKDFPLADDSLRRSIELFESLSKSHPDSALFRFELADSLSKSVGSRSLDQQRCYRSISICDEISKEYPQAQEYRALKATSLIKLSNMAGRNTKGEELLIEAIAIQRELVNRSSDVAAYGVGLFQSLKRLSELQGILGESEKSKENAELAEKELLRIRKEIRRR